MTDTTTLPPLPAPAYRIDAGSGGSIPGFSADQMQGFARAALAQSAPTAPSVDAVMERARDVRLAITKQCMDPCAAHVAACDRADSALRSAVEALARGAR